MYYQKDVEVLPANDKFGFVSNGNCIILLVGKFRRRLNVLKKQTNRPKQNKIGAVQPVHHKF